MASEPGQGSTFTVRLAAAPPLTGGAAPMTDQARSILVVDDDEDICSNLADILTDLGYRVDVAHDGVRRLELVRQRPYDVALLDLKMPGMDGLTLYREIKKLRPGRWRSWSRPTPAAPPPRRRWRPGPGRSCPSRSTSPGCWAWSTRRSGQPLVLVVDDDPDLCANLWDLLRRGGYRVCLAHDVGEAAERLREPTRVVLIDMKLPGGDGGEVFRLVREANPQARTVLITGYRARWTSWSSRCWPRGPTRSATSRSTSRGSWRTWGNWPAAAGSDRSLRQN